MRNERDFPSAGAAGQGVGARLPRKEDDRFLRGRGQFVGDIRLAGHAGRCLRPQPARARTHPRHRTSLSATAAASSPRPISPASSRSARSPALPGFKISEQPVLATRQGASGRRAGRDVRRADARARPRTSRQPSTLDLEELPAVHDMLEAREPGAPLVHEHWGDNVFLETVVDRRHRRGARRADQGDARDLDRAAMHGAARRPRRGRVLGPPPRSAHRSTPPPRCRISCAPGSPNASASIRAQIRIDLARCRRRLRLQGHPAAGGSLPRLAARMRCGHPVRWIEDRREHLTASANCREHHYKITVYADRDGTLRGIDCEATVDSGAYSSYPFSACLEAAQVASILPGPYDFRAYRCRTWSVATNKCPILPYRGVARTGVCFALELDARRGRARGRARAVRGAPAQPGAARADAVRQHHQQAFRQRRLSRGDAPRARGDRRRRRPRAPARGEPDGRRIGVGLAIYCEQGAHGTSVYAGWGIPMVPGPRAGRRRG